MPMRIEFTHDGVEWAVGRDPDKRKLAIWIRGASPEAAGILVSDLRPDLAIAAKGAWTSGVVGEMTANEAAQTMRAIKTLVASPGGDKEKVECIARVMAHVEGD